MWFLLLVDLRVNLRMSHKNFTSELLLPGPPHPLSTSSLLPLDTVTVHEPSSFSHDAKRFAPHDPMNTCEQNGEVQENNTQVK